MATTTAEHRHFAQMGNTTPASAPSALMANTMADRASLGLTENITATATDDPTRERLRQMSVYGLG